LRTDRLSIVDVLDVANGTVVRVAAPWLGILWMGLLPFRLLQVYFFTRASQLGEDATEYRNYLWQIALVTLGFFLVSLCARSVFVRACNLALKTRVSPGSTAFRVSLADVCTYAYSALLFEVLAFAFFPLLPVCVVLSGLAAVTAYGTREPGIVAPVKRILWAARYPGSLIVLAIIFFIALLVTCLNLYAAIRLGTYAAGGLSSVDLSAWEYMIRPLTAGLFTFPWPQESLVRLLVLAGGLLALEPFWLAANVHYLHALTSRETGEDLSLRFEQLVARRDA